MRAELNSGGRRRNRTTISELLNTATLHDDVEEGYDDHDENFTIHYDK